MLTCGCHSCRGAGVLMGVIALTSLPSITPKMNWREWRLLQSHAGWLAVTTATVRQLEPHHTRTSPVDSKLCHS